MPVGGRYCLVGTVPCARVMWCRRHHPDFTQLLVVLGMRWVLPRAWISLTHGHTYPWDSWCPRYPPEELIGRLSGGLALSQGRSPRGFDPER